MEFETVLKIVSSLLTKGEISALRSMLGEMNVVDIAEITEELEPAERLRLFRILPKDLSADVFSYLETDSQAELIRMINDREIEDLLDEMFIDDAVDFLEEVPANIVTRVLSHADPEKRALINRFLRYPESSAGSIMTIEMVQLRNDMTAAQAIENIRKTGVDKETVYTCYVTDSKHTLLGALPLLHLLLCDENTPVSEIMQDDAQLISVNTLDDQEQVAEVVKKYDLLSVPVVDNENRLVGIITVDDIVDVIEEETTEDFEKMAMLAPSDDEYLKTGVFKLARNRVLWLMVLMISGTFTGAIIGKFEGLLASFAVLTTAIPMLTGTAGNAGSQVSTLIIRGLAVGDIEIKDYFKVVFKELRVASLCGLALGVVNALRMFAIGFINPAQHDPKAILTVSLAMFFAVVVAKIVGCSMPVMAKAIKIDPALMSGPLISTLMDMITLLIYFALATAICITV